MSEIYPFLAPSKFLLRTQDVGCSSFLSGSYSFRTAGYSSGLLYTSIKFIHIIVIYILDFGSLQHKALLYALGD